MTKRANSAAGLRLLLVTIPLIAVAAAIVLFGGTNLRSIALAAVVLLPVALYAALQWPLPFLFGVYVALVPFDNLLMTGSLGTATKILGIVAGGFLALWIARHKRFSLASKPLRVLCLFAFWMLASTLWAIDQTGALQIVPTYLGLMLLYAVLTMVPISVGQFRGLLLLILIGGLCAAAYGAHAFYQNPTLGYENQSLRRLVVEVGQYHIDPNHFSNALLLPISIALMLALEARLLVMRIASIACLILLVGSVFLSGSRESLLALILIGAYFAWKSRHRMRLAIPIAGACLAAASSHPSVFVRFATALQTGGSGRTSIWAVALEAAKHRLIQGYGIGDFEQAFNRFYLAIPQPYPYGWDSPAHNIAMKYLVETGLVGLALIAWFFWSQFRSIRFIGTDDELYNERMATEAALLGIAFVSFSIDLFSYKYAWLVFSMVALLRSAALCRYESEPTRSAKPAIIAERSARLSTRDLPVLPRARSEALSVFES